MTTDSSVNGIWNTNFKWNRSGSGAQETGMCQGQRQGSSGYSFWRLSPRNAGTVVDSPSSACQQGQHLMQALFPFSTVVPAYILCDDLQVASLLAPCPSHLTLHCLIDSPKTEFWSQSSLPLLTHLPKLWIYKVSSLLNFPCRQIPGLFVPLPDPHGAAQHSVHSWNLINMFE